MGGFDSVGTLLADIATLLADALRILGLADKRHWGADEHEQVTALEEAVDEAKMDFQELSPLVNGQSHYEHDRKRRFSLLSPRSPAFLLLSTSVLTPGADESIEELRALRARFYAHVQGLKDWSRSGGPINPIWVRDTHALQKDLHRSQCRAARRIFTSDQESSKRCLGAFLVCRLQRQGLSSRRRNGGAAEGDYQRSQLEELGMCTKIGGFERFGDEDIAFICDFCDGHLVWEDLESVPTSRTSPEATNSPASLLSPTTTNPQWQATGTTLSGLREKPVVFAPLAVANHIAPLHGDWQAGLLCPFCEGEAQQPQDEDDDGEPYHPDNEFDDVAALQEHLEWQHTPTALPVALSAALPSTNNCQIM
ncbi:hypothetical protein TOPH_01475 [Tolypocladium ophioglossoides CBS 100239]|uniref:Uncharacterized protein n=1 Tax=Tolypocladium ophioglossoides (strain CBS 100239) TaxID=1163406 RepID=A0A0L0NI44_TOLOC|nr:hypothetical protein TOPH_01475 [Tolypocladium ophioglossoides CBS 100239]